MMLSHTHNLGLISDVIRPKMKHGGQVDVGLGNDDILLRSPAKSMAEYQASRVNIYSILKGCLND